MRTMFIAMVYLLIAIGAGGQVKENKPYQAEWKSDLAGMLWPVIIGMHIVGDTGKKHP